MKKKFVKRIVAFTAFASIMVQSFSYAKNNPYERQEFLRPSGEEKSLTSDMTIIDADKYNEYNPLNPVPVGVDKEEYDSVDNYNIDFDTLDTRIKYFAPAYLNIKKSAESSLWMSLYVRGGSSISSNTFKDSLSDTLDTVNEYKNKKQEKERELNKLKKEGASAEKIKEVKDDIDTYDAYYKQYKAGYDAALSSIHALESSLGHSATRYKIASVDDNNQVASARRIVAKSLRNLVLNYIKLSYSMEVLKEQVNLNKSIYETYLRNYENGVATALEVSEKLNAYEQSKTTYNSTNTIYKNLKEQVCINLGYDINDIDKLHFIEPEPDLTYIANINLDDDRDRAYNSNASYNGIKMSDKDKKFPGSTGESIYNQMKTYVASKVIVELENLYEKLKAAIWTYNGAGYLEEITRINDEANERKKETNLVSDVEYMGLKLQNLSYKLQVKNAKYDLIAACDDYYYAAMGNLSIS